jgi:molecular chaperone DnaK (HSP70)
MFKFKDDSNDSIINNLCLGIDFGTTNSCISVWHKNKAIIIPDIDGSDVIPTVIEIKNNRNKIVGKEAYIRKDIFENKETFLIYEIKKIIGKKYSDLDEKYIGTLGFKIATNDNDDIIIYNEQDKQKYRPEEIATHLFMSFKTKAELFLSDYFDTDIIINDAVISVPANFGNTQRHIIKLCAENSGLVVKRMINEPTAAAICYGIGKTEQDVNIMVYDFGGGTLDISILHISNSIYQVLCSCGNSRLGGSNFDQEIMDYCIREFIVDNYIEEEYQDNKCGYEKINQKKEKKEEINNSIKNYSKKIKNNNSINLQKLKFLSEQAKIKLSKENLIKIVIDNFYDDKTLSITISRDIFHNICKNLIWSFTNPIRESLESAKLEKEQIDEVIMVGGMTKSPLIRSNVELCMNKNVNCSINPDNVVSIGAAIHGFMINNNIDISDKLLLVDRTSLSIGVELSEGIFDIIIPRGTMIPSKKTKKYTTDKDNIEYINIKIYEGERKFVKDNIMIGDFKLSGITKQKKGIPRISVDFNIDIDGIITVRAEDLENSMNKNSICITNNRQHLSKEEINEIITNAKLMDDIDKIEKKKKQSHCILVNNSEKILNNISSENLKIPENIRSQTIENVTTILEWLKDTNYNDISIDKYKELLKDYKINYSIYLIINEEKILKELDDADECSEGTEIIDKNIRKKFEHEIDFLRNILNECDLVHKELNIIKFMSDQDKEKIGNFNPEEFKNIETAFNDIYNKISKDIMINIFINDDIDKDILNTTIITVKNLYDDFKVNFKIFNDKFNHINKLIKNITDKEENILTTIETISDDIVFYYKILKNELCDYSKYNIQTNDDNIQINDDNIQINDDNIQTNDDNIQTNDDDIQINDDNIQINDNIMDVDNIDNIINNMENIEDVDDLKSTENDNKINEDKNFNIKELINNIKLNKKIILTKSNELDNLNNKLDIINIVESEMHAMKSQYKEIKYDRIIYFTKIIENL